MYIDHCYIKATLMAIIDQAGIKYTDYSDAENQAGYHLVDGLTIKFWNIFPSSGSKVDSAVMTANEFLKPYGLYLAHHILNEKVQRLVPAIVPQKNRVDVRCKAYVDQPRTVISLLVKPRPDSIDFNESAE